MRHCCETQRDAVPRTEVAESFRVKDISVTLVDGHTHYHRCYDPLTFLNGAAANFCRGASRLELGNAWSGCLLLADMAGQHSLELLAHAESQSMLESWHLKHTGEHGSVIFWREDGLLIAVIAGRQLVCAECVEVLALGCESDLPDGLRLRDTLDAVQSIGAILVIPWGFGKWWFQRGRVIRQLVEELAGHRRAKPHSFYLGDSRLRPRWFQSPRPFTVGRLRGVRILPGTDNLPFHWDNQSAGSYGVALTCSMDLNSPANSVKQSLRAWRDRPRTYGRRTGAAGFLRAQSAMQLRKVRS